jgi:hypothetical protein
MIDIKVTVKQTPKFSWKQKSGLNGTWSDKWQYSGNIRKAHLVRHNTKLRNDRRIILRFSNRNRHYCDFTDVQLWDNQGRWRNDLCVSYSMRNWWNGFERIKLHFCVLEVQGKAHNTYINISLLHSIFPCQSLFLVTHLHALDSAALPRTLVCLNTMRLLSIAVLATLPIAFGAPIQVRLPPPFIFLIENMLTVLIACGDHWGWECQARWTDSWLCESFVGCQSPDCSGWRMAICTFLPSYILSTLLILPNRKILWSVELS